MGEGHGKRALGEGHHCRRIMGEGHRRRVLWERHGEHHCRRSMGEGHRRSVNTYMAAWQLIGRGNVIESGIGMGGRSKW